MEEIAKYLFSINDKKHRTSECGEYIFYAKEWIKLIWRGHKRAIQIKSGKFIYLD